MGVIQFMNCVEMFLGPALVALFVHDEHNKGQWLPVYTILGGCMIFAGAVFLKYSSVHPPSYIIGEVFVPDVKVEEKRNSKDVISIIRLKGDNGQKY